nr:PREDICTED: uncharacterized protein LOC106705224 [Latimeria chalumnae]|eukprot:XP_014349510.1 PREDICTED: uncharacterized protein LOC106705224 [Latimeria chalumnae]
MPASCTVLASRKLQILLVAAVFIPAALGIPTPTVLSKAGQAIVLLLETVDCITLEVSRTDRNGKFSHVGTFMKNEALPIEAQYTSHLFLKPNRSLVFENVQCEHEGTFSVTCCFERCEKHLLNLTVLCPSVTASNLKEGETLALSNKGGLSAGAIVGIKGAVLLALILAILIYKRNRIVELCQKKLIKTACCDLSKSFPNRLQRIFKLVLTPKVLLVPCKEDTITAPL